MADKYILVGLTGKRFAIAKRQLNGWWRVVATGTERDMKDLLDERKPSAPVAAAPAADRKPGHREWGKDAVSGKLVYRDVGEDCWRYAYNDKSVPGGAAIYVDSGPPR